MEVISRNRWQNLIIGALFIWVAVLAFQNPTADLLGIVLYLSLAAIVKGVLEMVAWQKNQKWAVFIGIIDFVIGIFFLFHLTMGMTLSPYLFAVWFICDSLYRFVAIGKIAARKKAFMQILNLIGLILGIFLLIHPIVSAFTLAYLIALNLLLIGVFYLFSGVSEFF
ncbi:HdeD family acid-resistance protein [Enterococcus sp. LJL98]